VSRATFIKKSGMAGGTRGIGSAAQAARGASSAIRGAATNLERFSIEWNQP